MTNGGSKQYYSARHLDRPGCYAISLLLLAAIQTPVQEANDLLKLDEQIRDRVRVMQAVFVSLLGEATATRHRLQGLHQRLGEHLSTLMTVSMKA